MIIALSGVFFGIKSYRDNHGGVISFWKGVQIGFLITLVAGVLYFGGAWAYNLTHPGFEQKVMQIYTEQMTKKMQSQGASQEQIEKAAAQVTQMQELFRNPALFALVCMIEIAPVGILISLISAALLRKRELLTAQPA